MSHSSLSLVCSCAVLATELSLLRSHSAQSFVVCLFVVFSLRQMVEVDDRRQGRSL